MGKILNKRSSALVNGEAKLPTASQIDYGEIAINFAKGKETISIKNSDDEIVTFSSDEHIESIIEENEYVVSQALNDINDRIPENTSDLTNDSGFITGYTETDPTVPSWAKQSTKPTYTANEVGALPTGTTLDNVADGSTRKLSDYTTNINFNAHTGNTNIHVTTAQTVAWDGKQNAISDLATIRNNAASGMSAFNTTTAHTADTSIHFTTGTVKTQIESYGYLTEHQSLDDLVSYAEYDSTDKKIYFYDLSGNQMTNYIDATDFIKDGMISSVTVSNGNLVMSFNTDAGREDITLALTQIFNPTNYYTKTDIDNKGYLTAYTETDPTVPAWAKNSTKPSYTASEVGALPTGTTLDNVGDGTTRKLSDYATVSALNSHTGDSNVHVTTAQTNSWNNKQDSISDLATIRNNAASGMSAFNTVTAHTANTAIHFTTGDVKTQIEAYGYTTNVGTVTGVKVNGTTKSPTNGTVDLGTLLTGYTETDPTVPAWAKNSTKPSYTASEVGALSTGATLDDVADGTTRKLSDYATQANFTAHTANTTAHVTSSEKSTWNGKQNAISDLDTIRNNAASGISAYNNMITGVTINGSAATVTNKNASINIETGGAGSGLPSVTSQDNGKILQVVNGQWELVTPSTIYTGQGAPDNLLGIDGDIYLQTS